MDLNTGRYWLDEVSDHDGGLAVDLQGGTHVVRIHGTEEQIQFISAAVKAKRRAEAKAARKSRRRNRRR